MSSFLSKIEKFCISLLLYINSLLIIAQFPFNSIFVIPLFFYFLYK
nr:MAG TPA: hypothetical protein [Caudoviricetes sp.]